MVEDFFGPTLWPVASTFSKKTPDKQHNRSRLYYGIESEWAEFVHGWAGFVR